MPAHRKFHEKEGIPALKKVHLVLLYIDEATSGELIQVKNDLKKALNLANIPVSLTLFVEKIEQALETKEHDIRFKVKIALLQDELTNILNLKNIPTTGISKLTDNEMHNLMRGNITSYVKTIRMALAALISLEGVI